MTIEEAKQLKAGDRLAHIQTGAAREVVRVEERGCVVGHVKPGRISHQQFFEWYEIPNYYKL
jgi:hypothetical protein